MGELFTFGLVHGAWHGAWCWKYLEKDLRQAGHETVSMDLPIDDPEANFDDYSDVVANKLKGHDNIVLVGHSRAGNVIPRVGGKIALRKLVYLCASFEPATTGRPTVREQKICPPRNSETFHKGINELPNGLTTFDPALAQELFYHDCPANLAEWAASQLRPQRRGGYEPPLLQWPNVPETTIICQQDRVVSPTWSRYASHEWLGLQPVFFPGGHSPFLSRPKELAQTLINLSQDNALQ